MFHLESREEEGRLGTRGRRVTAGRETPLRTRISGVPSSPNSAQPRTHSPAGRSEDLPFLGGPADPQAMQAPEQQPLGAEIVKFAPRDARHPPKAP